VLKLGSQEKNGRTLNGRTYDEMPEIELQHSV
jgi:protein gp37